MAVTLSPPPIREPNQNSYAWIHWFQELNDYITLVGSLSWTIIDFAGSDLDDLETKNHNDLDNVQGGSANNYYHLTSTQASDLTDAGTTILHSHIYPEVAAPTGIANTGIIYAIDNGSGKTKLMCIFGSGAAQQLAIEP